MSEEYYEFSNDAEGKTGMLTLCAKRKEEHVIVGYALTSPNEIYDRASKRYEAYKGVTESDRPNTIISFVDHGETLIELSRRSWESLRVLIKENGPHDTDIFPRWAEDLDMGTKAHFLK